MTGRTAEEGVKHKLGDDTPNNHTNMEAVCQPLHWDCHFGELLWTPCELATHSQMMQPPSLIQPRAVPISSPESHGDKRGAVFNPYFLNQETKAQNE